MHYGFIIKVKVKKVKVCFIGFYCAFLYCFYWGGQSSVVRGVREGRGARTGGSSAS